jgi:hypothetical protein
MLGAEVEPSLGSSLEAKQKFSLAVEVQLVSMAYRPRAGAVKQVQHRTVAQLG